MKKQNIPEEIFALITEEEINIFQELQIKIKELNFQKSYGTSVRFFRS